jgi:hypothetical protein
MVYNRASALGHAVGFRSPDRQPCRNCSFSDNVRGKDCTLSSYSRKKEIEFLFLSRAHFFTS